jgi:hypothetical protein
MTADEGDTVIAAIWFTVTVTVEELMQPLLSVPVTVYVVVTAGLAVTKAPVTALNPVAGLQLYVDAPLAVSGVLPPKQIAGDEGVTVTVGNAFTVTVAVPA